jgi:hypothetical protein
MIKNTSKKILYRSHSTKKLYKDGKEALVKDTAKNEKTP